VKKKTLNKSELDLLPVIREEWINRLLNPVKIDRDKSKKWIEWLYDFCGLKKPHVLFLDSPMAAQYACNLIPKLDLAQVWDQVDTQVWSQVDTQVRSQVGDQVDTQVRNQVWSQVRSQVGDQVDLKHYTTAWRGTCWDFGWLSFYEYFQKIGTEYKTTEFNEFLKLKDLGIFSMIQLDGLCVVYGMPNIVKRDGENNLHSDDSYAIQWPDGYGLYFMHGTAVPEYMVKTKAADLDIKRVLAETNTDVRLEGMRKIGTEKLTEHGKLIDTYKNYSKDDHYWWYASEYELYDLNTIFDGLGLWFKMKHQTIDQYCVEGVENCRTIQECLSYRNNKNMDKYETINIK